MATELEIRLWWSGDDLLNNFLRLLEVVWEWVPAGAELQGLSLRDQARNEVPTASAPSSPAGVHAELRAHDLDKLRASTGLALPVWRFDGMKPRRGYLRLGLECWGPSFDTRRDRRVEGDACLWLPDAGPYVALLTGGEAAREVNDHVEENVLALLELLQRVIAATSPRRAAISTDGGLALPINANIVWHAQRSGVLEDLRFLSVLWRDGLPSYQLPPLCSQDTPHRALPLHEWRPRERRQRLWEELAELIEVEPSLEDVEAELASGEHDWFDRGEGVMVLDLPHPFNAFLDRFYCGILRRSLARQTSV